MIKMIVAASQPSPIPSVHVRAIITWIAIFPLVTIGSWVLAPFATDWSAVLRAFVLSAMVVPLAVYLVVPRLMIAYGKVRAAVRRPARSSIDTGGRST